jgi:hypothetical protein
MNCAHKWNGDVCTECGVLWRVWAEKTITRLTLLLEETKEQLIDARIVKLFKCAYCGEIFDAPPTYVQGAGIAQEDILAAARPHVEKCPKHPMRRLQRDIEELRALIEPAKRALAVVSQFKMCVENPNAYFMELTGKPEPIAQLQELYDTLAKALEPFEQQPGCGHLGVNQ